MNLKRPTIRLSPLVSPNEDSDKDAHGHHQHHGLEFEFDCDAPQCSITLHVIGVPAHFGEEDHHDHVAQNYGEGMTANDKEKDHLLLYEAVVPGGFGRKLSLDDGAVLELARLEAAEKAHRDSVKAANAAKEAASAPATVPAASTNANEAQGRARDHKRRLTFFRKKFHSHSSTQPQQQNPSASPAIASGPALAVVDAESSTQAQTLQTFFANGEVEKARRQKEKEENAGGVKVAICLSARNEEGKAGYGMRNEQVTFLWVMKHGPSPSAELTEDAEGETAGAGSSMESNSSASESPAAATTSEKEKEKVEVEDTRPWVVKVVKREARIGPHAFQLYEIYGLTAHTAASEPAHPTAPTAPVPSSPEHTYPPPPTMSDAPPLPEHANEDNDTSGECLLCLSSPREVVLLPCRHLVACRDCAVNMVEFGAGGTVTQPGTDAAPPPASAGMMNGGTLGTAGDAAGAENGTANGVGGDGAPSTPSAATTTAAPRRKRKAKGWFCPVCRQRESFFVPFPLRPLCLHELIAVCL